MVETDSDLVQRMALGDRAALATLYGKHAPSLKAVAARIMHDDSDDLCHDVWLEAWEHSSAYDPSRGSVRTWLLMRLRSRAVDRLRSPRHKRRSEMPEALPTDGDQEEVTQRHAALRTLAPVFAALPVDQRRVLDGTFFDGLTAREIAEREGVPLGTIKSRLAAALDRLQKVLERE